MQALKKQPPQQITQQLFNGRHLSYQEMRQFAQGILSGVFSESQLGAALVAMKINGITAAELTALAEIMLEHAVTIPYEGGDTMDNCGTGGATTPIVLMSPLRLPSF